MLLDLPVSPYISRSLPISPDRCDVLLDCSGHTAGHRLTLLARRPCPVRAGALGFAGSYGEVPLALALALTLFLTPTTPSRGGSSWSPPLTLTLTLSLSLTLHQVTLAANRRRKPLAAYEVP